MTTATSKRPLRQEEEEDLYLAMGVIGMICDADACATNELIQLIREERTIGDLESDAADIRAAGHEW